jgi:hypothetical protein
MSNWRPRLLWVLILCALPGILLGPMGRDDSPEELSTGNFLNWIVLGPLWGMIAYLILDLGLRRRSKGRVIAFSMAILVWIVVAFTSNWWEAFTFNMRSEKLRRLQNSDFGAWSWTEFALSTPEHEDDWLRLKSTLTAGGIHSIEGATSLGVSSLLVDSRDFTRAKDEALTLVARDSLTIRVRASIGSWAYEVWQSGKKIREETYLIENKK